MAAVSRWDPVLHWLPRGLALGLAGFVGLFALDVFGGDDSFGEALASFVIHLAPTGLILLALAVAWRHAGAGAGLFLGLSGLFLVWFGADVILLLPAPALVIGLLFLADWRRRAGKMRS